MPEGGWWNLGGGKVTPREGRRQEKAHQRTREGKIGDLMQPKGRPKGAQWEPRVARQMPRLALREGVGALELVA